MSRYNTQGSPMEFEFQNGTGPIDARSPFSQISQNSQRFPPSMSTAQKRSYSAFDSPTKSRTTSPNMPLPAPPASAFNSLFTTPRKSKAEIVDDSSAGETPRSPEQNNDSDATPDTMNLRAAVSRLDTRQTNNGAPSRSASPNKASPTKEKPQAVRRESWVAKFKNKLNSPGRGEVASHAIEKRPDKRRRRDGRLRKRRHSMTDSEVEDRRMSPRKTSGSLRMGEQEENKHWFFGLLTSIVNYPTLPHILTFWSQFIFNFLFLGMVAYLCWGFLSAIWGDIEKEAQDAMQITMAEMAVCAREYRDARCDAPDRVRALEQVCENWSTCMNQDYRRVGRARMSAQAFAKIFNAFVEPISYKTMIFTGILVVGIMVGVNGFFALFRTRVVDPYQSQHYGQPGTVPPTPQRTFSGQDGGFYGTPWHQPPIGFEAPTPSGGFGQIDGRQSPVRRLAYN